MSAWDVNSSSSAPFSEYVGVELFPWNHSATLCRHPVAYPPVAGQCKLFNPERYGISLSSALRNAPICLIETSTMSPSLRNTRGVRREPTPP